MEIQNALAAQLAQNPTQPGAATAVDNAVAAPPTDADKAASDFDTYLLLLTEQLEHQDPLDPQETDDFATDLATFSAVEQQVKSNDLLEELISSMTAAGVTDMASWLGTEVRTDGPVSFNGGPLTLHGDPATGAQRAILRITGSDGVVVSEDPVPLGSGPYTFDGTTSDGGSIAPGVYSFELESYANGEVMGTSSLESYAGVTEVVNANGDNLLVLTGDVRIAPQDVLGVRSPQP